MDRGTFTVERAPLRASASNWSWTRGASVTFAMLAAGFMFVMAILLVWQSFPIWRRAGFEILTGQQWFYRLSKFGALPMIYGTGIVSLIALAVAAPLGIGTAIFTSEILPNRWRLPVKVSIELLSGVPSVIYGLLGILFLRGWMYRALQPFDPLSGDTLLTGGLLFAIMVLPTLMTLSDDALRSVPMQQRHAARGLGLTRAETVFVISLPQAWRGILAALLLALGRAFGEGIAVFMVIGRQDNQWPENLFSLRPLVQAGQTLTTKLVGPEINIAYGDSIHWAAIVALGLILLIIASGTTLLASWLTQRKERHAPSR